MALKPTAQLAKKIVIAVWLATAVFAALASIGTQFYLLGQMPHSPDPGTGRIYPTGAAYNTRVYVTQTELAWQDFLKYDLVTVTGCGVAAFGIVALIREHTGLPPLKIRDLWP